MTDFHLDSNYSQTTNFNVDSKDYFIGNYSYETCWGNASGPYGDYNCDSPIQLMESAIQFIGEYSENIDVSFVVWTGYLIYIYFSKIIILKVKIQNFL